MDRQPTIRASDDAIRKRSGEHYQLSVEGPSIADIRTRFERGQPSSRLELHLGFDSQALEVAPDRGYRQRPIAAFVGDGTIAGLERTIDLHRVPFFARGRRT